MKDYTKFSEPSNNTEKEKLIEEQLKLMSDDPVQNDEVKETWAVTEENDGVHVRPVVDGEIIDTPIETIIKPDEIDDPENVESELPEVDEDHTGDICPAKVIGCTRLNVRKEPSKDSEVVCIITDKSTVTVSRDLSTEDFYKVYTSVKDVLYEGYCMKKFINVE